MEDITTRNSKQDSLDPIAGLLKNDSGNIILKAGAGTGKTYNLTQRVLNLITGQFGEDPRRPCRLDEVLALTFTEDAASEMRERIYQKISEAILHADDPLLQSHLRREKREFSKNFIMTFHGFCHRILQCYPDEVAELVFHDRPDQSGVSAGLSNGYEILDDYNEALLSLEWHNDFYRLYRDSEELIRQLNQLGRRKLESLLENLSGLDEEELLKISCCDIPDYLSILQELAAQQWKEVENLYKSVITSLAGTGWLKKMPETIEDFATGFLTQRGQIQKRKLNGSKEDKEEYVSELNPLTSSFKETFEVWQIIDDYLQWPQEELQKRIAESPANRDAGPADLEYWNFRDLSALALTWKTYMRYRRVREGKLGYSDLIELTGLLMDQNEAVANQLRSRFRFLLIDEFQDTDLRQWKIVKQLSRLNKGGNIMIVGDIKQAIYRFRGGDAAVMRQAEQEFVENEDSFHIGNLPFSFRSNQQIVTFTNHLFAHAFADHHPRYPYRAEPGNLALPPEDIRKPLPKGSVKVLDYESSALNDPADEEALRLLNEDNHELEALRIAQLLYEITAGKRDREYRSIGEKIRLGEKAVGILLKSRTHQSVIEEALRLYNLPFVVTSGRSFYQRQEIIDIWQFLAFLLDSHDDIAFTGLMRSPFAGLSDAGMLTLRNLRYHHPGGRDLSYWDVAVIDALPRSALFIPPDQLVLEKIIPLLISLRSDSRYKRVSELLERALYETDFLSGFRNQEQTAHNIDKLIDTIHSLEQNGRGNLFEIVEFLSVQITGEAREEDAVLPQAGSIQIMTIHGAKGLQFPMVILPDLYNGGNSTRNDIYLCRPEWKTKIPPLFACKIEMKEQENDSPRPTPLYTWLKYQDQLREIAEVKRLFYVAVTRAETHLVLCDTATYKKIRNRKNTPGDIFNSWRNTSPPALFRHENLTEAELETIVRTCRKGMAADTRRHQEMRKRLMTPSLRTAMKLGSVPLKPVTRLSDEFSGSHAGVSQWKAVSADEAGTLVHKLVELNLSDRSLEEQSLGNLLIDRGYSLQEKEVREDFQGILTHADHARIWLRKHFSKVGMIRHEVEFESRLNDASRISGTIDLLIEDEDENWHVIDFKTSYLPDHNYVEHARQAGYDQQLRIYCEALHQISEGDITVDPQNAVLLFTREEEAVAVRLAVL